MMKIITIDPTAAKPPKVSLTRQSSHPYQVKEENQMSRGETKKIKDEAQTREAQKKINDENQRRPSKNKRGGSKRNIKGERVTESKMENLTK